MQIKAFLLALAGQALAAPASTQADGVAAVVPRQTAQTVTDQLLFGMTLPSFTSRRNAKNPPTLDWSSDNCSNSPDNPLGFPFSPACHRHDFGYRNYKKQSRFTDSARLRIDNNFKTDLYMQCSAVSLRGLCEALADVYYTAVRLFGGSGATPGKRDDSQEVLVQEYEAAVARYNQLLEEARANGEVSI